MTGVTQRKLGSTWGSLGPEDKEVSPSCGQLRPEMGADRQPDSRIHGRLEGCLRAAGWESSESRLAFTTLILLHTLHYVLCRCFTYPQNKTIKRE